MLCLCFVCSLQALLLHRLAWVEQRTSSRYLILMTTRAAFTMGVAAPIKARGHAPRLIFVIRALLVVLQSPSWYEPSQKLTPRSKALCLCTQPEQDHNLEKSCILTGVRQARTESRECASNILLPVSDPESSSFILTPTDRTAGIPGHFPLWAFELPQSLDQKVLSYRCSLFVPNQALEIMKKPARSQEKYQEIAGFAWTPPLTSILNRLLLTSWSQYIQNGRRRWKDHHSW